MRLWRRKRAKLATPSGEIETPMRNGALVALVSYDVWEVLSIHDRNVLLRVDDCMAGRYDVAELRRRLYPVDRERIYDGFYLTAAERERADEIPDDVLRQWADAAESRGHFLEWLDGPHKCSGCENEDKGGAFVTGVAVSHNFGPGCRLEHPSRVSLRSAGGGRHTPPVQQ